MRFKTIRVKNFQGVAEHLANLQGKSANIYGRNGKGKTTVFKNAILWNLFEKDHRGHKLDPKPRKNDGRGERIRGLIPEVELVIELDNGAEITLLRRLEEKVVKKTKLYKADEGYWEVDGVGVNKTQFDNKVKEIIGDPEIFSVMLNPEVFLTDKKWDKRRSFLEKMMGEVQLKEVIKGSDIEILNGKPLNDALEIARSALKKAEDKLSEIAPKMEEAQRKVPGDPEILTKTQAELKTELDETVNARLAEEEACKNPDFSKRSTLIAKIDKLKERDKESYNKTLRTINSSIDDLEKRILSYNTQISSIRTSIPRKQEEITNLSEKLDEMRAKYSDFESEKFEEAKCVTCGQDLPVYLKEEYEKLFNIEHAKTLKEMLDIGKSKKIEITELNEEVVDRKIDLEKNLTEKEALLESINDLREKKKTTTLTESPEIAELTTELNSVRETGELQKSERLAGLEGQEKGIRESIATFTSAQNNVARVKELEKEEEDLGEVVTECRRIKDLTLGVQRKWNLKIEQKVNKLFSLIKWRLSEEQKNGEPKDVCEAMYKGIDYNKTVSNGEGVNMCYDLHKTISDFYGIKFPFIADNSESVTDWLVESDNQVIYLYADKKYDELKMEIL